MDETIHIYIESVSSNANESISATKKRLWPSLIISLRWLFSKPISGRTVVQNGLGLSTVNSLAIAVEGFVGDLLVDYFYDSADPGQQIIKKIENSNWSSKVRIYNKTFPNSIKDCAGYEAIEILMLLRNYTAHGRTHREKSVLKANDPNFVKTESIDYNYREARQYFEKIGLLKKNEKMSNSEMLWNIRNVVFLMSQVQVFLYSLLQNNKSDKFKSILSELENAFKMSL